MNQRLGPKMMLILRSRIVEFVEVTCILCAQDGYVGTS